MLIVPGRVSSPGEACFVERGVGGRPGGAAESDGGEDFDPVVVSEACFADVGGGEQAYPGAGHPEVGGEFFEVVVRVGPPVVAVDLGVDDVVPWSEAAAEHAGGGHAPAGAALPEHCGKGAAVVAPPAQVRGEEGAVADRLRVHSALQGRFRGATLTSPHRAAAGSCFHLGECHAEYCESHASSHCLFTEGLHGTSGTLPSYWERSRDSGHRPPSRGEPPPPREGHCDP